MFTASDLLNEDILEKKSMNLETGREVKAT